MSEAGWRHQAGARGGAHDAEAAGENQLAEADSAPLHDRMRGVRAQRSQAAAQIQRSLKVWRKVSSSAQQGKIYRAGDQPVGGELADQLGEGPETSMVHEGNAVQAGVQQPPQHHVLPQERRDWFADRGVDVDAFCVNVDQAHHEAIHLLDWNDRVMKALEDAEAAKTDGSKLSESEMVTIVRPIMAAVGIDQLPFVQYGSERPEEP